MKPSVTKLTELLDKPRLLSWANKIGLQGIEIDKYRKDVMGKGSSIHHQIESYLKTQAPFDDPVIQRRFIHFMSDKRLLCFEENIETDYFVGRLDIMFEWNSLFYICDFKLNKTKLYLENKLQLTAYRMGRHCAKVAIISIPDFVLIESEITDFTPYEDILKSLSVIYNCKKSINE
jgi:hypothetical protein